MPEVVKNTYWRPEHGSTKRSTALLRLPAALVALIEARKPATQSLNSFLGDLVVRGLGEEPTTWRFPTDEEGAADRKVRGAALIDQIDAVVGTFTVSGPEVVEEALELSGVKAALLADINRTIYGSTDGTLPEDEEPEW